MNSNLLELTCKTIDGQSFNLTFSKNEDIDTEVKQKIADRLGVRAKEVKLIYEGKCVYGDDLPRTLGVYNVRNGGTLHVIIYKRAY